MYFDETNSWVVLILSSAFHTTTVFIQRVYIFIKTCYKCSLPCVFEFTRFVQLIELRGIQILWPNTHTIKGFPSLHVRWHVHVQMLNISIFHLTCTCTRKRTCKYFTKYTCTRTRNQKSISFLSMEHTSGNAFINVFTYTTWADEYCEILIGWLGETLSSYEIPGTFEYCYMYFDVFRIVPLTELNMYSISTFILTILILSAI